MIQNTVKDKLEAVRGMSSDDVLSALGLERRRTPIDIMIPAAGIFLAGFVVGAGVAMLVAPMSGREARRQLRGKATDLSQRLQSQAGSLAHEVRDNVFGSGEESRPQRMPDNSGDRRAAPPPPPTHHGPQK